MNGDKITVYWTSEFMGSISKAEGRLVEYGTSPYAQYPAAPFVTFVPRGKRNPITIRKTYKPYLVILAGWNNPDAPSMYGKEEDRGDGVVCRQSKFSCFDDGYRMEFDEVLRQSMDRIAILADYRAPLEVEV